METWKGKAAQHAWKVTIVRISALEREVRLEGRLNK